ncbi:MAG: UDP-2,3-diacylglucosamine diphosphatase [Longimicrobiales bacterium]
MILIPLPSLPMIHRPVYLASDIHLGATSQAQEDAFLTWLAGVPDVASALIINGDLFDFWFEYARGIPTGYERALTVLREVVDTGLPVTLMGGNHDWWGGAYLRDEIGVEFLQDPVVRTWSGFRTLLAHGDGVGAGDLGYRLLKPILRGRLTRWAFGQLGPTLGDRVAGRVSRTEGRWEGPGQEGHERAEALERWAVRELAERPELDLVVLGHTHLPRIREVSPGRWYVNAGDWVYHRSYLVLEEGAPPSLREWEGAPERL